MGNGLCYEEIITRLTAWSNPGSLAGMARYGICTTRALGVSMPRLRDLAKECGQDHDLAGRLWASGIHEARILASLVEEPGRVSEEQTELWVSDFDSWDLTDQTCASLFRKLAWAWEKVWQWGRREEEYVRRAGFALLALLAVHDRHAPDDRFESYFPLLLEGAEDPRNYVKKAVNWALRQIGKRNLILCRKAIVCAEEMARLPGKSARWIAADALRELKERAARII